MTLTYTKPAADVFAPTTAAGAPRGADMDEARTWGVEIEAAVQQARDDLDAIGDPVFGFADVIPIAGTSSLLVAALGKLHRFTGTAPATWSLPSLDTANKGGLIAITNAGTATLTVSAATDETIGPKDDGTSAQTLTLRPGDRCTLVADETGANWQVQAMTRKVGVAAGNVVAVADDGFLPALDGRRLTNLPVVTTNLRTALKLGTGYISGGGKAGALIIASDGWAYTAGATPVNGNNLTAREFFEPLRLYPGEAAPTLPFVKAVRSQSSIYLLDSAGVVYCCGGNASGQLGIGHTTDVAALARMGFFISGGITITDIIPQRYGNTGDAGGTVYFIGSASGIDRGVWAVGRHDAGQLGDGSTVNSTPRSLPVRVSGPGAVPITGITKLRACGWSAGVAMALKSDGTLYFWGYNGYGISADGTTANKAAPVVTLTGVADFDIGMDQGSASRTYAVALMSADATMRAIGANVAGQHGTGGTTATTAWVQPTLGLTGAASIRALCGGYVPVTAIITAGGRLKLCGRNANGQIGDGTTTDRLTFYEPVFSGQGKVTKVLGGGHSADNCAVYALDSDGLLWSAGYGTYGALGSPLSFVPATQTSFQRMGLPIPGDTIADFELVPATTSQSQWGVLARGASGTLYATGYNDVGQLGLGHTRSIVDGFEMVRL